MQITLLRDCVLVKPIVNLRGDIPSTSKIIIPDTETTDKRRFVLKAKVVRCGPGRRSKKTGDLLPLTVKEGDTVLIREWSGQKIKEGPRGNQETYLLITDVREEIMARYEAP